MRQFTLSVLFLFALVACQQSTKKSEAVNPKISQPSVEQDQALINTDTLRTEWQNPELVVSLLGDISGETVLDIGAGAGYFTFKLANKAEKVIALEIDPKALEYIEEQKVVLGPWTDNIEARLTPPDVPNLTKEEVDKVLIVNTFPFLPNRTTYLPRLLEGMKPGAKLVMIDFKIGEMPVGPADEFKLKPRDVRKELKNAGFDQIKIDTDQLSYQYIITAKKR